MKRSIKIAGHATSISLEDEFWSALNDIADQKDLTLQQLIEKIDEKRRGNLSSAIRVYILKYYKDLASRP